MIRVNQQPEPANFELCVRRPGNRHLADNGVPEKSRGFPSLWKRVNMDLFHAFGGICAYTCRYILPPGSVDHYLPKVAYPNLAYEWGNYRLASQRANSNKGDSTEVLDPFAVTNGWFEIDFPSCLVKPGENLSAVTRAQVVRTIEILKLNNDDSLVQDRCDTMIMLADGDITLNYLARRYPFLAYEVTRQNLGDLNELFKERSAPQ